MAATSNLPARIAALSATELAGATPAAVQAVTRDSSPAAPVAAPPDSVAVGPAESPVAPSIDTVATDLPAQPPVATTPPAATRVEPIVAEGRTDLHDGIYALRRGDTVIVHFDTPQARTRRGDKFEQIVRATLPATHGAAAGELLAATLPGDLVGARDVVAELPARGIHLRTSDGRELSIWPETRAGRDGPLVVAYRAIRPD